MFMHRLLERAPAPAPTLWAMNDARSVSEALLRRMMFALELRPPTTAVRARIWTRQLEQHGIEAGSDEAHELAREFAATPGVAAGATAAARIAGGGIDTVRLGVRGLSRVLSCEAPPQGAPPIFDPALIRADTDPVALADRLAASGERRFSLCLQGPPGTGKSAFVRYLAERMRIEVMQKRASDLMSMWVGGTEQNIAAAFAEARDTGTFLIFDEADSLLADRRGAERSFEVSQVNEMLTWMESHPLPFACTTNFGRVSGRGDPQALRLQGRARLPLAGAGRGGLPHLFRPHAAGGNRDAYRPHPRRLRRGAAEGRAPGPAGGTGGARRHAERRMRGQAGPAAAGGLQGVGAAMPLGFRASPSTARLGRAEPAGQPESRAVRYERLKDIVKLAIRMQACAAA